MGNPEICYNINMDKNGSKKEIDIFEVIKTGWTLMVEKFPLLASSVAIIFGIMMLCDYLAQSLSSFFMVGLASHIVRLMIYVLLLLGFTKINLMLIDGQKPEIKDLFSCYEQGLNGFWANILYMLTVFAGFLLLVFPAFIWGIKYQFFYFFIAEKGLDPFESFRASARMTKGIKWPLLRLNILLFLINILGVIMFGVGVFFTLPLSILSLSLVYRSRVETEEAKKEIT